MVSTGSLPSASRDHWWDRWLMVGTGALANATAAPDPQRPAASRLAASRWRHPLFTASSYGRGWVKSSATAVALKLVTGTSRTGSAQQAGEIALVAGQGQP